MGMYVPLDITFCENCNDRVIVNAKHKRCDVCLSDTVRLNNNLYPYIKPVNSAEHKEKYGS